MDYLNELDHVINYLRTASSPEEPPLLLSARMRRMAGLLTDNVRPGLAPSVSAAPEDTGSAEDVAGGKYSAGELHRRASYFHSEQIR